MVTVEHWVFVSLGIGSVKKTDKTQTYQSESARYKGGDQLHSKILY